MPATEDEKRDATEDEVRNLRHVIGSLPFIVWIALVASGAERFTFYAVTTPWRKFNLWPQNHEDLLMFLTRRELHAVSSR